MANFNRIAPFYDFLSSVVFGKQLIKASECYLNELPFNGNVLYIGGGSGILLNKMLENRPNITIDFVEPSSKFIELAKQNLNAQFYGQVNFIQGNHLAVNSQQKYDVIITFFVLDIFTETETQLFCKHIYNLLVVNGLWLNTDFEKPTHLGSKLLLKSMYVFFKLVSNINTKQLPDYDAVFKNLPLEILSKKLFFHQFIGSSLLVKPHHLDKI